MICQICKKEFKNKSALSMHVSRSHKIRPYDYQLEYIHFNSIPKCKCGCGAEVSWSTKTREFSSYRSGHNPVERVSKKDPGGKKKKSNILFSIQCKECGEYVANTMNILGAHLRKVHGIEYINYILKYDYNGIRPKCACGCEEFTEFVNGKFRNLRQGHYQRTRIKKVYQNNNKQDFSIKCLECNQCVGNSKNVLGRHLRNVHNIEYSEYLVKHEYGNNRPRCKCGCGEFTEYAKGVGFRKFIKGHDSRGEFNNMYGKRGEDNPNFGKIRTEEMKQNYSDSAKKSWEEKHDERCEKVFTDEYKEKMSEVIKDMHEKNPDVAKRIAESMKEKWQDPDYRDAQIAIFNTEESKVRGREKIKKQREDGNIGPHTLTAESRRKLSESAKKLQSDGIIGVGSYTPESIEKISEKNKLAWKNNESRREKLIRMNEERWADPENRKKQSELISELVMQGLVGPHTSKTEWKFNPFTNQDEYMHSTWESHFLEKCINDGVPVTKKHGVRIPYNDENGYEHIFIPDFVSAEKKILFEIKGFKNDVWGMKNVAAAEWCDKNGYEYVLIEFDPPA